LLPALPNGFEPQSEGTYFFSGTGLVQQGQYKPAVGWQSTDPLRVGTAAAV
jgi:hypothetical protein